MGRIFIAVLAATLLSIQFAAKAQPESTTDRTQQRNALRVKFLGENGEFGLLNSGQDFGRERAYSRALFKLDSEYIEPISEDAELVREGRCASRDCAEALAVSGNNQTLEPVQSLRATLLGSDPESHSVAVRWAPPALAGRKQSSSQILRYEIAIIANGRYSVYSVSKDQRAPLTGPRRGGSWHQEGGRVRLTTDEESSSRVRRLIRRSAYIEGIEADDFVVSATAVYESSGSRSEAEVSRTSEDSAIDPASRLEMSGGVDLSVDTVGEVPFDDPDLRQCVIDSYPKGEDTELTEVVALDCSSMNISSLGGIEYLSWLTTLNLFGNPFSGVGPLSDLVGLQSLNIGDSSVTRLSPLGSLQDLRYLYMASTQVSSLSAVNGLPALEELDIRGSDISAIPDMSFTQLAHLDASETELVDVSGVRDVATLETIDLARAAIGSGGDGTTMFGDISAIIENASSPDSSLSRVDLTGNSQVYCFHLDTLQSMLVASGGILTRPNTCGDIPVPTNIGGAPQVSEFNSYVVAWSAEGQLSDSYFRIEESLPETNHQIVYASDSTQLDMSENPEQRVGVFQYRVQHCHGTDLDCSGWSTPYDQVILASPSVPGEDVIPEISDPALQACLADHMAYETEAGEQAYLLNGEVESLNCGSWGVTDLSGVELLPNLTSLQFYDNEISELAPLELLLDARSFGEAPVSILLEKNQIASSELAHISGPESQISQLNLTSNQISDINDLSGLGALTSLRLDDNGIGDLSPISEIPILILKVERNSLTSIPDLSGTGSLQVAGNSIDDLPGIASIQGSLIALDLSDNPVPSAELSSHLTSAPELDRLFLERTTITDVQFASSTPGLQRLRIDETDVVDLSGLGNLPELKEVSARATLVNDLQPLEQADELAFLEITGGDLSGEEALQPLASINSLAEVVLADNGVTNIAALIDLVESTESSLNPVNFSGASVDLSGETQVPCGDLYSVHQGGALSVEAAMDPECLPDNHLTSTAWLKAGEPIFDLNWDRSQVPPGYFGTSRYEIEYVAADGSPMSSETVEGAGTAWAELALPDPFTEQYEFRVRGCRADDVCGAFPQTATMPFYPLETVTQAEAVLQPDGSAQLTFSYSHSSPTPQAPLEIELSALFDATAPVSFPLESGVMDFDIADLSAFPGGILRLRVCRTVSDARECGPTREVRAIQPDLDPDIATPTNLTLGDDGNRLRLDHGEHFLSWDPVDDSRVDYYRVQRMVERTDSEGDTHSEVESEFNLEAPMLDVKRFDGDPDDLTSYRVQACEKSFEGQDACSDYVETEAIRIDGVDSVSLSSPTDVCWFWSENDNVDQNRFSLRWTYPRTATHAPRRFLKGHDSSNPDRSKSYNQSSGFLADESGEVKEYWEVKNVTTDHQNIGIHRYGATVRAHYRGGDADKVVYVQTYVGDGEEREWNYDTQCDDTTLGQDPNSTNSIGPDSLSPGHYATWDGGSDSPYPGAKTGWSFYWTKEPREEGVNDSFGRAYDLLAFWYTYRKREGESELTPVWYYARLHQTDPDDESYVSGTLMYPQAGVDEAGNERNDISVGELRIDFRDDRQQADVSLDIRHDSHLVSFSGSDSNPPEQEFSIRDVSTDAQLVDPDEDFGDPNPTDHFSGIWTPEPDTPFTDLDQILEQNEAFFSEWIVGNFASIGVKGFDLDGDPIWFIQFKCQYSDDDDHCYSDEDDPIDFSLSRHMGGFNTVFPGPGTGPLDLMSAAERAEEISTIAAGGSGLRRKYNEASLDEPHTQQRNGDICVNLNGSLPAEGDNSARPYDISIGHDGEDCDEGSSEAQPVTKIANLHYISVELNGDSENLNCSSEDVSEGACTAELTWFTDGFYPSARPIVSQDAQEPEPLEEVCANVESSSNLNPFEGSIECELNATGSYRFHLANRLEQAGGVFSGKIATSRRVVLEADLDSTPVSAPQQPFEAEPLSVADLNETSKVGATSGDFEVSEAGAAVYSIPIMTAPAPGDVAPMISIDYNSSSGSGRLGPRWDVGGLSSITRCRETLEAGDEGMGKVDFGSGDRFCLDGARLKLTEGSYGAAGSLYRLEVDSFTRIEAVGQVHGEPAFFRVYGSDGSVRTFGSGDSQSSARIEAPVSGEVVAWPISEFRDSADNFYEYSYFKKDFSGSSIPTDTLEWGIDSISYTGNSAAETQPFATIEFEYEDLPSDQQVTTFFSEVRMAKTKVIGRIMSIDNESGTLRDYRLFYSSTGLAQNQYVVDEVYECWDSSSLKNDLSSCFEPTGFEWEHDVRSIQDSPSYSMEGIRKLEVIRSGDMNGDGKSDVVYFNEGLNGESLFIGLSNESGGFMFADSFDPGDCFANRSSDKVFTIADPFGEGRSSIFFIAECNEQLKLWSMSLSDSNELGQPQAVKDLMHGDISEESTLSFVDWSGDGALDLLVIEGVDRPEIWYAENVAATEGSPEFGEMNEASLAGIDNWWEGECERDHVTDYVDHDIEIISHAAFNYSGGANSAFVFKHTVELHCELPWRSDRSGYIEYFDPRFQIATLEPSGTEFDLVIAENDTLPEMSHFVSGDINGDGYSDFVYFTNEGGDSNSERQVNFALNQGGQFELVDQTMRGAEILADNQTQYSARLLDYDGDGYLDLLIPSAAQNQGAYWKIYHWRWEDGVGAFAQTPTRGPDVGNLGNNGSGNALFDDVNGDSRTDYIVTRPTGSSLHSFDTHLSDSGSSSSESHAPGYVASYHNGFGAWTDIEHKPLTDPTVYRRGQSVDSEEYGRGSMVYDIQQPHYVVSSVTSGVPQHEINGAVSHLDYKYEADATATVRYFYAEGRLQSGGRGHLGFREVSSYDGQSGVLTTTKYSQKFPYLGRPESTRTWHLLHSPWPASGASPELPSWPGIAACDQVDAAASSGALLTGCSENVWDFIRRSDDGVPDEQEKWSDNPMVSIFLSNSEEWNRVVTFDGSMRSSELTHRVATVRSEMDQFGNPGRVETYTYTGNDSEPIESKVAESFFDNHADVWHLGRMICTRVETERADVPQDIPAVVRTTGFSYSGTTGLLEKEVVEPDPEDCSCSLADGPPAAGQCSGEGVLVKNHSHDEFGNRDETEQIARNQETGAIEERRLAGRVYLSNGALVDSEYEGADYTAGAWEIAYLSHYSSYDQFGNPGFVEDSSGLVLEKKYDRMGRPLEEISPTGSFSRTVREMPATAGGDLSDCPEGTAFKERTIDGTGAEAEVCKDVLGRKTRTRKLGFSDFELESGQIVEPWIHVDVHYDYASRVVEKSAPYFAVLGGAVPEEADGHVFWTRKLHDEFGRIIEVTRPIGPGENASETVIHNGLEATNELVTTTVNDQGQERVVAQSVLGDQRWERSPSGSETDFKYDHLGNLVTTDGPLFGADDVISIEYDSLGNKEFLSDPDKGDWIYEYDALGNLQHQIDEKGQATIIEYDFAGRKERRLEYAPPSQSSAACNPGVPDGFDHCVLRKETTWSYGEAGSSDYGLVIETSTTDYDSNGSFAAETVEEIDYDWAGRPFQKTTTFNHSEFAVGVEPAFVERWTYDEHGRELQHFDASSDFTLGPSACSVSANDLNLSGSCLAGGKGVLKVYNEHGALAVLKEAEYSGTRNLSFDQATYWKVNRKDARGNVIDAVMGNEQKITADFSPATGWLQARLDVLGSVTAQAITYHWDSIGRLQSRSDLVTATHGEVFSYDSNNRLTKVEYTPTGDPEDLEVRQRIRYDEAGNITCKSDVYGVDPLGAGESAQVCSTTSDGDGEYQYNSSAGPHAVSRAGSRQFEYDENGNVVRDFLAVTGGDERSYEYSVADRLLKVSYNGDETRFFYGASREKRIKRTESASGTAIEWTFYVGSTEITHSSDELQVSSYSNINDGSIRRYVNSVLIAEENVSSGDRALSYLHRNHQGSIVAISGRFGGVKAHMRYDAWGARREIDQIHMQPPRWTESLRPFISEFLNYTNRGYTGHEHLDDVGIIHMNGRIYDPVLGRFLQADPLVEDVGTLNRYTYVHNNPLAYVDPNGFLSVGNIIKGLFAIAIGVASGFSASVLWAAESYAAAIAVAAIGGAAAGVISTGTSEGALFGAFTAVAALGIVSQLKNAQWAYEGGKFTASGNIARGVGIGTANGISADLQGGKFGHAFFTAGVSSMASPAVSGFSDNDIVNTFAAAALGGTLSEATGGKFANGAATAAFAYTFSQALGSSSSSTKSSSEVPSDADLEAYLENSGFWDSDRMLAQEDTWKRVGYMGGAGSLDVRAGRRIKLVLSTDALGVDGSHILAGAYPLDAAGNYKPAVGNVELQPAGSGHVATFQQREVILDAGYESKGGFEWIIEIPKTAAAHNTSAIRLFILSERTGSE